MFKRVRIPYNEDREVLHGQFIVDKGDKLGTMKWDELNKFSMKDVVGVACENYPPSSEYIDIWEIRNEA